MTDRFICTNPKHSHGGGCFRTCACRCDVCRAYNNEYRKRYDHERNVFLGRGSTIIPAGPTTARLRAPAWMRNAAEYIESERQWRAPASSSGVDKIREGI